MALGGDLRNINLADIFQTLSMNQQTGTLVVRNGVKEKRIFFSEAGVSLVSGRTIPGFQLGTYLLGTSKITEDQLKLALEEQRQSGEMLGRILVAHGFCEDGDVEEVVRYHAAEELHEIFSWDTGEFEFLEGTISGVFDSPSPYALVHFDPGGVVMEAARRIDEWDRIRAAMPSNDDFFVHSSDAPGALDPEEWGADTAAIYALADGTRSIGDILEQYHLSPFDTGSILFELVGNKLIRPCTFSELTQLAWGFLDQRNRERAARCLERAHLLEPGDLDILGKLVDCYDHLEKKKEAAAHLLTIAKVQRHLGNAAAAQKALEQGEKFDPGSAEIPALLMRLLHDQGEVARAADKACTATSILCEHGQHEAGIRLCQDALVAAPTHINLRIALANAYLGAGQKVQALDELEQVASALEESRRTRRLVEIYKKILQLDSSRREYLRRLQEIKEGEVRRRKNLLRAGALGGGALLLLTLFLFVFTGGGNAADRLSEAWSLLRNGDLDAAEKIGRAIAEEDPESETAFDARNLLAEIERKRKSGDGPEADMKRELVRKIEGILGPAAEHVQDERWGDCLDLLLGLTDFLRGEDFASLRKKVAKKEADRLLSETRGDVFSLLDDYVHALEHRSSLAAAELAALGEIKLNQETPEAVRAALEQAERACKLSEAEPRTSNVLTAKGVENALDPKRQIVTEKLDRISADLDDKYAKCSRIYHQARALTMKADMQKAFHEARQEMGDYLNSGDLEEALAVCDDFIRKCKSLSSEQPAEFYAPVAEKVLGDTELDLDGKMGKEREKVAKVIEDLSRAEALVGEGQYAAANALFRRLITQNWAIDFRTRVNLVLLVRTRPSGANVTLTVKDQPVEDFGATGPDGILVRYPPYGKSIIDITLPSFNPVRIVIQDAEDHDAAPIIHMRKLCRWRHSEGGPAEARCALWEDTIVVPSRDGHVRGYGADTGEMVFDYDTGLLSGFAARPAIRGHLAYLTSLDRKLLAFDMKRREVAWMYVSEQQLRTAPLVEDDLVIVGGGSGEVFAVRAGKELWKTTLEGRIQADPVLTGDSVLVGTTASRLYRLDARTGKVVWQTATGGPIYAPPTVEGDRIYAGTDSAELLALDLEKGGVLWRSPVDNAVRGQPILHGGAIHLATLGGSVYRISAETGEEIDHVTLPDEPRIESGVSIMEGRVYTVSSDGILFAIDPGEGISWSFDLEAVCYAPPLIRGRLLYVATDGGEVFCFAE